MKFVANLVGILSIPIYYVVLSFLFSGSFLAFARLSEFFGVEPWFLTGAGLWFVLPVGLTLSIWLGHTTYRFLRRRWAHDRGP
jgi:Sec-independent protein secretion pathway component TatC